MKLTEPYTSSHATPELVRVQSRNAPRTDEIIGRLTQIWEEILCTEPIVPDQNYFDLGGDSVLAVQLFVRIEQEFKIKLPLASLFDAPTIQELAVILGQEASTVHWSALVPIQTDGTRPPFFCMHPHGGNVLVYRDLAQRLGTDQPFYGLQSPGLDGSRPPLGRIEDMAALYVREVRRIQPTGPYFLGGYCMGGTIAYEMAQQLHAQGEEVGLLAMFDTHNWAHVEPPSLLQKTLNTGERLTFHVQNLLSLSSAERRRFMDEKLKSFRSRFPAWPAMLYRKIFSNRNASSSNAPALARTWQANWKACAQYRPQPYHGTVIDIRPAKQYRMYEKANLKWDSLALGGQQVTVLPVNAPAMLSEPFVSHLAEALRKSIDEAICRCKT
jgi:phthiocerol/phenolphthiocerol synthesis type-I polyketide synthase E